MKNSDKYLPIGSIVKIGDLECVIVGYRISHPNVEKKYDYMGYSYPYGFVSSNENIVFDAKDIKKIIFEGYKDVEYQDMLSNIEKNNEMQKEEIQ